MANGVKNLINQRFGRLTVVERAGSKNNRALWKCICDCGNEQFSTTNDLTTGNTKSCGCLHKEILGKQSSNDLTNQKFGRLLAKRPTEKRVDNKVIWECLCDCGNICYIQSTHLVSGHTQSCGCIKDSIGETNIANILIQNNIQFEQEFKFLDLLSEKSYPLRYDFYLPAYNRLIEFDGEQHYKDTGWGHVEETKYRDQLKNEYALFNNIPLVRIPYWERNDITLEMLLGDKYLVKE